MPDNLYLIGTMNTADRSIALLDTALRRRFGFIELMPDVNVLGNAVVESIPLGPWLSALNSKICENIGRDARNLQVGHSYLLENGQPISSFGKFVRVIQDDIIPLLEEYCYEDYSTLTKILGKSFVDEINQRIHADLFEPAKKDDLIQALKSIDPNLDSSPPALLSDAEMHEEDHDEQSYESEQGIRRVLMSMQSISIALFEWQSKSPQSDSGLKGVNFGNDESVRRMANALSESGRLGISELATGLSISASSYVGTVRLGNITDQHPP
jgi:hypothetical protein